MASLEPITDDVLLLSLPLSVMGCRMGRNVTVIRLASGRLVIHSTAPFSVDEVEAIRAQGDPGWLVEATHFHDTCAAAGRRAFPDLPYFAPSGFPVRAAGETRPLSELSEETGGELEVLELAGMPRVREHAVLHRPSRTLIIADLLFNLDASAGAWTRGFLRLAAGLRDHPGQSRFFRHFIEDEAAFRESAESFLAWNFDRIVVGHGRPVLEDARATLRGAVGLPRDPE